MLRSVTAFLLLSMASSAYASDSPPATHVRVDSLDLAEMGTEEARFSIQVAASTASSATLRRLVFDKVLINDVKVHIPPVTERIRLRAGQVPEPLPQLEATLRYRDLDSLEPLRRVVRNGTAHVHAVIRAELELTLFQKLALLGGGAWTATVVDQEIDVSIPGGAIGRLAALAALTTAEPLWIAGQSALEWRRSRSELAESARVKLSNAVVLLETRYELTSRAGETSSRNNRFVGFVVDRGRILAPAEAVEPWAFDPDIAEALASGDISVNESKLEILATPASEPRGFALSRKELRIRKALHETENLISSKTKRRYRIRFRNSDANAVLLEIPAWRDRGTAAELADADNDQWQPAAVVRTERQDAGVRPFVWLTEARLENGRYILKDAVDPAAFGSPLMIAGGVAGLVQDENSAAAVRTVLKKLR